MLCVANLRNLLQRRAPLDLAIDVLQRSSVLRDVHHSLFETVSIGTVLEAAAVQASHLPFHGEGIDMLGVLTADSIEVRRQQVSIGASNFIETKPLSLLLIEADSMQQSQR